MKLNKNNEIRKSEIVKTINQKEIQMKTTTEITAVGIRLKDLSIKDLREELYDLNNDLKYIDMFLNKEINFIEFKSVCFSFDYYDRSIVDDAIKTIKAEIQERNTNETKS